MNRKIALTSATALGLLASTAFAHPGHGLIDFGGGITHPLTGIDHLAAMTAVGLWAAQLGKRAVYFVPLAFVAMMLVGALLGFAHVPIPFAEQAIAASLLVLGLLITFALRMPTSAGMLLVGLFALFHGYAHGAEMPGAGSTATFAAGFLLSTLFLHAVGLFTGLALIRLRHKNLIRVAGLALVTTAALLITGIL